MEKSDDFPTARSFAHKLHSARIVLNKIRESQNQSPTTGFSLFRPGSCPANRDHRNDVNQAGREVAAGLPRVEFAHWVLVDLPATLNSIDSGQFSNEVSPGGKQGPEAALGARQGINDFTAWFAADEAMKGDYYGYDGPCPPWNDQLVHRYVFTLYALDVERCAVAGRFTMAEVRAAMAGHILAEARLTGTYTLNPALQPPLD